MKENRAELIKRILVLVLTLVMVSVIFTSCTGKPVKQQSGSEDGIKVVATIFPQYDFARQILGGSDNVKLLLKPGAECHSYEPTPEDIISIQECDLFIYVGGESDAWIDSILESIDTSHMKVLKLMDMVSTVEEEHVAGMAEEKGHEEGGEEEIEYDEHVWTSPVNAVRIISAICDAICQLDPSNSKTYEKNANHYENQLEKLSDEFQQVVNRGKRKNIVFGDRFPIKYFVDQYGLKYSAAYPGCSSETEVSASTIAYLIDKVKSERIPVVFYIELSNAKIATVVAEAAGAKALLWNSCHNLTSDDFKNGETYLSLMTDNLENLRTALN